MICQCGLVQVNRHVVWWLLLLGSSLLRAVDLAASAGIVMAPTKTLWLIAVLGIVGLQCAHGFVHTQINKLSKDCQRRYDEIITSIPAPSLEGEKNCTDLLTNATSNTDGAACPAADTLVACFQVITLGTFQGWCKTDLL